MDAWLLTCFARTLGFALVTTLLAACGGMILGGALGLQALGLGQRRGFRLASTVTDLAVSCLEYFPLTAVLIVVACLLPTGSDGPGRFLRLSLAAGLVLSAPMARAIENLCERELRKTYPRQMMVLGLGPIRDVLFAMVLPAGLRELSVVVANTFGLALVADTSVGYLVRFASATQHADVAYYVGSFGACLADRLAHHEAIGPGLLLVVGAAILASLLSDRLSFRQRAESIDADWHRGTARPDVLLSTRGLALDVGGDAGFTLVVDDLEVREGDVVWLSGASGSGKSLLFKTLMRVLPEGAQARGTVSGRTRDIHEQAGLIFQEPALYLVPHLRIGRLLAELGVALDEASDKALRRLGQRFRDQCSAGQKRLVFNRVLMHHMTSAADKTLLFCDEPDASLDFENRALLIESLEALRRANARLAIVYITHDQDVGARLEHIAPDRFRVFAASGSRIAETRAAARRPAVPARGRPSRVTSPDARMEPTNGAVVLAVSELGVPSIRVRGKPILAGFELEVRTGERVALVGRNGRGKSTLVKALMGLLPREVTRFEVGGADLREGPWNRIAERMLLLYEDAEQSLPPRWSVGRIARRFAAVHRCPPEHLEKRMLQAGLGPEFTDRLPMQLSGGQRQMFCFALATALPAVLRPVIVMDEPFTRLDDENRRRLLALIGDDREHTFLLISHQREDLEHLQCRIKGITAEEERYYAAAGEVPGDAAEDARREADRSRPFLPVEAGVVAAD